MFVESIYNGSSNGSRVPNKAPMITLKMHSPPHPVPPFTYGVAENQGEERVIYLGITVIQHFMIPVCTSLDTLVGRILDHSHKLQSLYDYPKL